MHPRFLPEAVNHIEKAAPIILWVWALELRYVQRADVEPIVTPLRAVGMNPVAMALGGREWLAVLDQAALAKRAQQQQRVRLLSVLAATLAISLWFSIGWRQHNQLEFIEQKRLQTITELRGLSDEVTQLRQVRHAQRLVADSAGRTAGEIVLLLATVLPASVSPSSMTVEGGAVRLVVAADSAEVARTALANNASFEQLTIEHGAGGEATITAICNPARPQ